MKTVERKKKKTLNGVIAIKTSIIFHFSVYFGICSFEENTIIDGDLKPQT